MDKILAVARREFLATVRTKAFLLSVVLMPALIVAGICGGDLLQRQSAREERATRRIAVLDYTGLVFPELAPQIDAHNAERPAQQLELEQVPPRDGAADELAARVRRGELYAYVILSPDAVSGAGGCTLARKDNPLRLSRGLEDMVSDAVVAARLREAHLNPEQIEQLRARPVPIQQLDGQTGRPIASEGMARVMTPFAFMFLLFMGTFGISQSLLTTLIEEKSSRVVEVLLSAVSPTQLLAGKILGMVTVGFLLVVVWGGVGFASAQKYNVAELVTGYRVLIALLYFVPGFLLLSSLLAAIGSACNELKDAQSMVFPLSLITIVPMIFWFYIAEHPDSLFSLVLSYVPPVTPMVMILRVCADPYTPWWQLATTLAVLWVSVFVAMWTAGKVFRVGVLMYGKPPSLAELLRWVRYS
jgi:ABC-2 type transport system permease protein